LLIITQNGAKQRLLLTMVPKQQQNSWKMMWYVGMESPSLCLLIMAGNGLQNLMLCVRITVSNINTLHPNGPNAMGWRNV
jgi:hypothetical protein